MPIDFFSETIPSFFADNSLPRNGKNSRLDYLDLEKTFEIMRSEKNLKVAKKYFSEVWNDVRGGKWSIFYLLCLCVCVRSDNILEHNLEKSLRIVSSH